MPPERVRGSAVPARRALTLTRRWLAAAAVAAAVVAAAASPASAATSHAGVTVLNCGFPVHVDRPPTRAITLNQGATETLLALGLQNRMIGTAYLDDAVLPSLRKAYDSVPVVAKEYPSAETFLSKRPDFAFASYSSAFSDDEGVGTREQLRDLGIATMLQPSGCAGRRASNQLRFSQVWNQLRQVGQVFGIRKRTEQFISRQRAALRAARGTTPVGRGVRILWWDSETKAPLVGTCCGGPGMIIRAVGATNVFSRTKGNWANVSWEAVLAAKPDVIVLANASWDTAAAKRTFLAQDDALQALPAVREERFVVIPFSDSTPGVRNVHGVRLLAEGLRQIAARG